MSGVIPGVNGARVVQIHVSRRCNLRCLHCYSSSGPQESGGLDLEALRGFLDQARAEDYAAVSISGGEPFLYASLGELVKCAKGLGFHTAVATNGTIVSERLLDELNGHLDQVAISVDGPRDEHNRMRGAEFAFDRISLVCDALRARSLRFGFIHTLTAGLTARLGDLIEWVLSQGGEFIQIHPLERVGYAYELDAGLFPSDDDLCRAYLGVQVAIETWSDRLQIQYDICNRRKLVDDVTLGRRLRAPLDRRVPLSSEVDPIVVGPAGELLPMTFGIAPAYSLGRIGRGALFAECDYDPMIGRLRRFRTLCADVIELDLPTISTPLVNWYELLRARSHRDSPLCSPG